MPLFSKFLYILISCDKAWIADTLIPIWNSCSFVESQLRSKHVKVKLFILHRLRNKLLQLIEIIPVGTNVCIVFMWVETLSTLNTAVLSTKWQHDYPMSTLVIKQGLKRWKGSSLPQHLVSEWLVRGPVVPTSDLECKTSGNFENLGCIFRVLTVSQ